MAKSKSTSSSRLLTRPLPPKATSLIKSGARVVQWVRSLVLTAHTSLSPIRHGLAPSFVNYKKGCTRLAAASDKVYQLLAQGRWFSLGTPASSTTKTGRHDIAEILLKVELKHQKSNQSLIKSEFRCTEIVK
jgi:hypothetical protein